MSVEAIVQDAIYARRPLLFSYEDDELPERLGHPHALFLGPDGATCVDVYQVGGFTRTATLPAWRTFVVSKIVAAERIEDTTFSPAPGWDPLGDKYAGGVVAMI